MDTANAFYAPTMAALTSYVPETQIVFGTDYPYLSTGQNLDGLRKLVTPAQMAAIAVPMRCGWCRGCRADRRLARLLTTALACCYFTIC